MSNKKTSRDLLLDFLRSEPNIIDVDTFNGSGGRSIVKARCFGWSVYYEFDHKDSLVKMEVAS
jgi:hypothetical protein